MTGAKAEQLWGKSAGVAGRPLQLVQHLLDTAAVMEILWDEYLAPRVRDEVAAVSSGSGRSLLAFLAGVHDVGKASPAFQAKDAGLADGVRAAGLDWRQLDGQDRAWHHTLAGAVAVEEVLAAAWGQAEAAWVWPLVLGHHGLVGRLPELEDRPRRGHGGRAWDDVRMQIIETVACAVSGRSLAELRPVGAPSRSAQLAVSGLIVMADWIASSDQFPGLGMMSGTPSMEVARRRARAAWDRLGLGGGWSHAQLHVDTAGLVRERFGVGARPVQRLAVDVAEQLPGPGLMILEAPMGEGKTEAALAAVEVLARRFGADGLFVGMPTQATADPMFTRVLEWVGRIDPAVPVGLLHGRRQFNRQWRRLQQQVGFAGVDIDAGPDEYGMGGASGSRGPSSFPAEWFLGRKRGLLVPVTVGTVDQLLWAATRTRHVMLRFAGLAGRIVVLDEVHAYDVFMGQFLGEALRWLAAAGVPVVLLSATLPADLRQELLVAYAQGLTQDRDVAVEQVGPSGYPQVTSMCAVTEGLSVSQHACPAYRPSTAVRVTVVDEPPGGPDVVGLLDTRLGDGGVALVVQNTVGRAQHAYGMLRDRFPGQVVLLHSRLTAARRAELTERLVSELGPGGRRPDRLVVVGTQVVEQSFDIDADVLISDLAPVDLLLQRAGRLHRHALPAGSRPVQLSRPELIVVGIRPAQPGAGPSWPPGSGKVYAPYLLLRTAALLDMVGHEGWSVPAEVPRLVEAVYGGGPLVPDGWVDAERQAHGMWVREQARRAAAAGPFLLAGADQLGVATLAGLHDRAVAADDEQVAAVVRDGPESVEVTLLRQVSDGYATLSGRRLGPTGEGVSDEMVAEEVAADVVRLPGWDPGLTAAARELEPLPAWAGDRWFGRSRVLLLDQDGRAELAGRQVSYDDEFGLQVGTA